MVHNFRPVKIFNINEMLITPLKIYNKENTHMNVIEKYRLADGSSAVYYCKGVLMSC